MTTPKFVKKVRINISEITQKTGHRVFRTPICTLERKRRNDWKF